MAGSGSKSSHKPGEVPESAWIRAIKRAGDLATSLQAIIAACVVIGGGVIWLIGKDEPKKLPRATIAASERTAQNIDLAKQLAAPDNSTQLKPGATAPADVDGDVHAVAIAYTGHDGACRITYQVFDAATKKPLPESTRVEPSVACRTEGQFHQDIWVPNPNSDQVEAYNVRFILRDGDGVELDDARTPDYTMP